MRSHLKELHTNAADYHTRLAKAHNEMGKCFSKLANSDGDNKESFGQLAEQHKAMSAAHADAAEQSIQCCKSLDKAASDSEDRLEPTHVSLVYKSDNVNLRAVPRGGAPQNPGAPNVPLAFQDLIKVEDDGE